MEKKKSKKGINPEEVLSNRFASLDDRNPASRLHPAASLRHLETKPLQTK